MAGGLSKRMGEQKARLPFDGVPLVAHVAHRISSIVDEILVVSNDESLEEAISREGGPTSFRVVADRVDVRASLVGLYSGLTYLQTRWAVAVACDMPFVSSVLLSYQLSKARALESTGSSPLWIVPSSERGPEPLHAVVHRDLGPRLEARIHEGQLGLNAALDACGGIVLDVEECQVRAEQSGFADNLNTRDEYRAALERASRFR